MTTQPNDTRLRILMLEDRPSDAALGEAELQRSDIDAEIEVVSDRKAFVSALARMPDVIIADYAVPGFGGPEALKLTRARGLDDIPFIIFSGTIGEDRAVEMIKAGATDFVSKDRAARLPQVIRQALESQSLRRQQAAAEKALRATIESALDCIVTIDEAGTMLEFNPAAERTFGFSRADVIGRPMAATIMPPRYRDHHARGMAAFLRDGTTVITGTRIEVAGLRADGTEFPLELTVCRIGTGRPALFTAFMRDITDRVGAQEKLRAQEEQYRVLFQSNPNAMWVYDLARLRVLAVNDAAVAQYGYSPEEFLNLTLLDLRPADEGAKVIAAISAEGAAPRHAGTWKHRHADGRVLLVDVYSSPTTFEGSAARMAVLLDVTEKRRAEDALRESELSLANAQRIAQLGSWDWDLLADELTCSRQTMDLFGFPADAARKDSASFSARVHPEDQAKVSRAVGRALAGTERLELDHRVVRPDGTTRTVHEQAEVTRDESGVAIRMTGTVQDVTERKHAERAITRTLQRLTDAQRIGQIGDWEWDIATQAITWSPQVFEIFGRDPSLGPPRDYEEYAGLFDAQNAALLEKSVTRVMTCGEAEEHELQFERANGELAYLHGMVVPRKDESGQIIGLSGTLQDISARKRTEAAASRLLNVLEASLNEIYIFDSKTLRFEYTNECALRNLGYSIEEMRLKTPLDLKPDFTAESFEKLVAPLRQHDKPKVVFQTTHRRADESLYPVEVHLQLVQRGEKEVFLAIINDITARKRSEAALRASEERFARAFEFAPMGMAIVSTDGRWLKVNQALCRLLGYSRMELTGMKFSDVTHPESRAADDEILRRLLAREIRYFHAEKRYLHKNGGDVWVWLGVSMVSDPEGRPLHFISQIQDITARKEAEALAETSQREQRALAAELRAEKDRLVAAQAVAKIGSWETNLATNAVIWSDETYRIFELTADELEHSPKRFWAFVHPDDRGAVSAGFAESMDGRSPSAIEHRLLMNDGRIKYVEERWQIDRAEDGTPLRSIGTCQDITDRRLAEKALREAEEKFRAIFDNASEGIFQTTLDGAFLAANPALARMTRFDSPEELIRERNDVERQGYLNPTKRREFERLISETGLISNFEYELKCKDGGIISVSENTRIVHDDAGNPLYYEGSLRDITEHKRAERNLEELNKQLLENSRHAGMAEVATSVLHNVGNVLNSVNVSCSVISDKVRKSRVGTVAKVADLLRTHAADLGTFFASDPAGQKLPEFVAKLSERLADEQVAILTEVQSLSLNIAHIKEIVAVQQSYANVRGLRETLPITGLVEDALRINAEALSRYQIEVIQEFRDLPPTSVDKHKVLQILVNLVRNAKHALVDCGRTDKRLTMRVAPSNDTRFHVSVSDNGIGIDPQNITRVFAHGFTTKKNGHGYGLHSGVLAAQEMGGSLTVESAGIGRGATFTLELPLNGNENTP